MARWEEIDGPVLSAIWSEFEADTRPRVTHESLAASTGIAIGEVVRSLRLLQEDGLIRVSFAMGALTVERESPTSLAADYGDWASGRPPDQLPTSSRDSSSPLLMKRQIPRMSVRRSVVHRISFKPSV